MLSGASLPWHAPLPPPRRCTRPPAPAEEEEEGEGAGFFFNEGQVLAGAAAAALGVDDVEEVQRALRGWAGLGGGAGRLCRPKLALTASRCPCVPPSLQLVGADPGRFEDAEGDEGEAAGAAMQPNGAPK